MKNTSSMSKGVIAAAGFWVALSSWCADKGTISDIDNMKVPEKKVEANWSVKSIQDEFKKKVPWVILYNTWALSLDKQKELVNSFGFSEKTIALIWKAVEELETDPSTYRIISITKDYLDQDREVYVQNMHWVPEIIISYWDKEEDEIKVNWIEKDSQLKVESNGISYWKWDLWIGMEVVWDDWVKISLEWLTKTNSWIIFWIYSELWADLFKTVITFWAKVWENWNLIFACWWIREKKDFFGWLSDYVNQWEIGFEYIQKISDWILEYFILSGKLTKSEWEELKRRKFIIETDSIKKIFEEIEWYNWATSWKIWLWFWFKINENNRLELSWNYEWIRYSNSWNTENEFWWKWVYENRWTFWPLSSARASYEKWNKVNKFEVWTFIPFLDKSSVGIRTSYDFEEDKFWAWISYSYRIWWETNSVIERGIKERKNKWFDDYYRLERQKIFERDFLGPVFSKYYKEKILLEEIRKEAKPKVSNYKVNTNNNQNSEKPKKPKKPEDNNNNNNNNEPPIWENKTINLDYNNTERTIRIPVSVSDPEWKPVKIVIVSAVCTGWDLEGISVTASWNEIIAYGTEWGWNLRIEYYVEEIETWLRSVDNNNIDVLYIDWETV